MSFRRHVQVLVKPNTTLPDNINFVFSGMNCRVFISTESVRCFNCGEFGHISRNCKKPQTSTNTKQSMTNAAPVSNDTRVRQRGSSPPPTTVSDPIPPSPPPLAASTTMPPPVPTSSDFPSLPPRDRAPPLTSATPSRIRKPQSSPLHTPLTSPAQPSSNSTTTPIVVSSKSSPPKSISACPSPVWKTPPSPVRSFSEVVSKRKQLTPESNENNTTLTTLKATSPLRKVTRKAPSSQTETVDSPALTQVLDSQTPNIPPTPSSSVGDCSTDTDSMTWEDAQTDEDIPKEDALPLTQGPLSQGQIVKFLSNVKGRKKPAQIARKYTSNIPGLVKQLKPLKNSPLVKRNMQQRIYKLISTLES
ncbi:proline-rich receptor-like protein kinase PERK9 [Lytechinus variegatus]|uniref:proline-rich receptor-like protein kinase PERK9 n=1 Tax=Lytechinus variegatus TaxID=7654 RepID=UPI001BB2B584|nr:proline-rich receptor-like protein kinase PERK9 [Lytechinus variegatus]